MNVFDFRESAHSDADIHTHPGRIDRAPVGIEARVRVGFKRGDHRKMRETSDFPGVFCVRGDGHGLRIRPRMNGRRERFRDIETLHFTCNSGGAVGRIEKSDLSNPRFPFEGIPPGFSCGKTEGTDGADSSDDDSTSFFHGFFHGFFHE